MVSAKDDLNIEYCFKKIACLIDGININSGDEETYSMQIAKILSFYEVNESEYPSKEPKESNAMADSSVNKSENAVEILANNKANEKIINLNEIQSDHKILPPKGKNNTTETKSRACVIY